jgi:hypothetical protein
MSDRKVMGACPPAAVTACSSLRDSQIALNDELVVVDFRALCDVLTYAPDFIEAALAPQGDDIHVLPVNDLRGHLESDTCWCRPRREEEGASAIIVHNAMDQRETYERGRKPQ